MRNSTDKIFLLILIVFSLTACAANPTVIATLPYTAAPTSVSVSTTPIENNSTDPLTAATVAPTTTIIPQATAITNWTTFVFINGVSIDYPLGWTVAPSSALPYVDFISPKENDTTSNTRVRLAAYQRPLNDREIANPYSWENNEGGYTVHWEKPIYTDGAEGLEFVWGAILNDIWETPPILMAVYYSEAYELDVRLETFFDKESVEVAETIGLPETIATRFSFFEHMVGSIRFNR